jgi:sodium-dependent dicarboxylate transporter 2/3/5
LFLALITAAFSIMMAAGAAVAVLGPVFLKVAVASGDDPLIVGFIVAIASSFTYLTVASTPASTIMYALGYLSVADFQRVGWRVIVVALIILLLLAQFYWPAIAPS